MIDFYERDNIWLLRIRGEVIALTWDEFNELRKATRNLFKQKAMPSDEEWAEWKQGVRRSNKRAKA